MLVDFSIWGGFVGVMATTSKPQKPTYQELVATIQELRTRIVELEAELAEARENSETSSKPPYFLIQ